MTAQLLAVSACLCLTSIALAQEPAPRDERPTPSAAPAAARAADAVIAVDDGDYKIGPEDVLDISVWKNQELSRTVPVRPDGKITIEPKKPKRPKTWMDDTEGGVEWSQKYVIETAHYVIKTNVKKEYAKRWAKILEALAENVVAEEAWARVDGRMWTAEEAERLEGAFGSLEPGAVIPRGSNRRWLPDQQDCGYRCAPKLPHVDLTCSSWRPSALSGILDPVARPRRRVMTTSLLMRCRVD